MTVHIYKHVFMRKHDFADDENRCNRMVPRVHTLLISSQLCNLYENDCIFDKFECAVSGDASNVLTGSYGNMCHMYDRYGQAMGSLEVSKT